LLYRFLTPPQIFLLCAVLAGIVWLYLLIGVREGAAPPRVEHVSTHPGSPRASDELRVFLIAGFLLNFVMMSFIFALPLLVDEVLGAQSLWMVLIPATIAGVIAMRIAIRFADAGKFRLMAAVAFAAFLPSTLCLFVGSSAVIALGTAFFMGGYLSLMALLPAGVARSSGHDGRGSISGMFQTAQFMGAFLGATLSGLLWQFHPGAALGALTIAAGGGLLVALRLSPDNRSWDNAGPLADKV
jgi:hypothetical protein